MSKINENRSQPIKVPFPDGSVKDGRLIFTTHKIRTDKDTQELIDFFAKGVEIIMQIDGDKCVYIICKQFEPSRIALGAPK